MLNNETLGEFLMRFELFPPCYLFFESKDFLLPFMGLILMMSRECFAATRSKTNFQNFIINGTKLDFAEVSLPLMHSRIKEKCTNEIYNPAEF